MEFIEIRDQGAMAIMIENCPYIDLAKTFDCGQCFRFEPVSMFGHKAEFGGVVFDRYVVFAQNHFNELIIYNIGFKDIDIWKKFFDLDSDYDLINKVILENVPSEHMKRAVMYGKGIRILRQSFWECLVSFIISQNNNIPRIKKIIDSLCKEYGRSTTFKGQTYYTFPSASTLISAGVDSIAQKTKMGFRAKYVVQAAKWYTEQPSFFLKEIHSYEQGLSKLCEISGVGPKVASCVLLFSLGIMDAFPVDVHIKRTLEKYFDSDFDISAFGEYAGIAQQYLFYYEKYNQST